MLTNTTGYLDEDGKRFVQNRSRAWTPGQDPTGAASITHAPLGANPKLSAFVAYERAWGRGETTDAMYEALRQVLGAELFAASMEGRVWGSATMRRFVESKMSVAEFVAVLEAEEAAHWAAVEARKAQEGEAE